MGGRSNTSQSGGNSGGSNASLFTWQGGDPGSQGGPIFGFGETGFDPGDFGKTLGHDTSVAYGQGPKVFDQSLYAGLSPETSGLIQSGLGAVSPVAGGSWLNGGNPFFEANLQKTLGDVTTGVNSTFQGANRFGGLSHQQALADSLGNISNQARGQNFENEWSRMLGAQGTGLGLSGMLDADAQARLAAENDLYRRQNDAGLQHVSQFMGLFGNGMQSGALQQQQNPFANLFSTGLGLAGLFL